MGPLVAAFVFFVSSLSAQSVDVFHGGQEGYACYRIPSIMMTMNNTLNAFAEGRKYDCGDHGYVDLVYKRSTDFGVTWSNLVVLYSNSSSQSTNTIGNPSPVQDRDTGKIWMLFCKNNKQIHATYSVDDGLSFSLPPKELDTVNNADWNWVATGTHFALMQHPQFPFCFINCIGPPSGIQLDNGRLVVPFDWSLPPMYSTKGYVVYSDDGGDSWILSESFGTDAYWPNESQAVQLKNGSVFINSRTGKNDSWYRVGSLSNDGGSTFVESHYIEGLTDTEGGCEGSMVRAESDGNIYYSGLTPSTKTSNRANMTMSVSKDDGNSFEYFAMIEAGSAGYSSVVEMQAKRKIAVLYERDGYQYLSFKSWDI